MMSLLFSSVSASALIGGVGTFDVTVPSGTVGSDLTDFPVMVDLNDMPVAFWLAVREDGGNVRAYAADGTTLIPHDLTHIDTASGRGRFFVKHTLTTASDTTFKIKVLDAAETTLDAGDTNGRNAVWSDYETVTVFPEIINRVDGSSATSVGAYIETYAWKETDSQYVNCSQGVAFDGTHYYSVATNYLRKYARQEPTSSGAIVASNTDPVGDVNTAEGITNLDHCGAPDIVDGELWVPVQEYPNNPYDTQFIGRYSLADLSFIGSLELTGATREASGFCYDSTLGRLYVTDYTVNGNIPYFNKTSGAFMGTLTLSEDIDNMQGMCICKGKYYVGSGGNGVYEVEFDGTVNGLVFQSFYIGGQEGVFSYGDEILHAQDSGWLRHYSDTTEDYDWVRIHGTPLAFEVPNTTVWTVGVSWVPTPNVGQQGIVGVYNPDYASADRHSLMFDAGPDRLDAWNPTDSWFSPSPDVNPVKYEVYRPALGQNGTTERKLWVDGEVNDTEAGSSARPLAGANMAVAIAGGASSEHGYGSYQFGWLRAEYMSDDWMAADAENMNNPSGFYSITAV